MKEPPFFQEKIIAYDSQYHSSRNLLAKFYTKKMLIYKTPQEFILKLDNNIFFKDLQLFYKKQS